MIKKIVHLLFLLCLQVSILSGQSLKVSAIGDIMAHKDLQNYVLAAEGGYNLLFSRTKEFFLSDDLTIANLETSVNDELPVAGYPRFNARTDLVQAVKTAGIDVVALANNHCMDNGYPGLISTIQAVKDAGLIYSGIDSDLAATRKITVFSRNGFIIGFISLTESVNGIFYADSADKPCVNLVPFGANEKLASYLTLIKETRPYLDVLIVAYHGGKEYVSYPIDIKTKVLHKIAEAGADVILAHHPHVLQPVSYLEKKDGKQTLIAYSLGNFVSAQSKYFNVENDEAMYESTLTKTSESIILQFDIVRWNNTVKVINPRMIPIFTVTIPTKLENSWYNAYIPYPVEDIILEKKETGLLTNLKVLQKLVIHRLKKIGQLINLPLVNTP